MQIEKEFEKLLFQENSVETKLEILRKLDPLKLEINDIIKIVDYFRSLLKKINLGIDYYGFTGTGGDVHKTINATVLACVVAACDIKVCKVGSIGVTSKWGSLDLVREIGYKFPYDSKILKQQLEKFSFCFVAPGTLGIPYSGELVKARRILWQEGNYDILKVVLPSSYLMDPKTQIIGVYDIKLVPLIVKIFKHLRGSGIIVHSYDGIDEFSNTSENLIVEIQNGKVKKYKIKPKDLGIKRVEPKEIAEFKDLKKQVECSWNILSGKETAPKKDFVALNTALLLYLAKKVKTLKEGLIRANKLIESGDAYQNFKNLLNSQK